MAMPAQLSSCGSRTAQLAGAVLASALLHLTSISLSDDQTRPRVLHTSAVHMAGAAIHVSACNVIAYACACCLAFILVKQIDQPQMLSNQHFKSTGRNASPRSARTRCQVGPACDMRWRSSRFCACRLCTSAADRQPGSVQSGAHPQANGSRLSSASSPLDAEGRQQPADQQAGNADGSVAWRVQHLCL